MGGTMLTVRISEIVDEAIDIRSFRLEQTTGAPLPPFDPGSHIDVHLYGGLVRQYSLCTPPGDTSFYRIAVKNELSSRGGSAATHALRVGDALTIGAPRNNFPLNSGAEHTNIRCFSPAGSASLL
jgi:vanillate O-demethylase ferredoxin subunit